MKFVKIRALPIGIDLGASSVKIAQLRQTDGETELLEAGYFEMSPAMREEDRLGFLAQNIRRHLAQTGNFKGRQCILGLPAEDVTILNVRMPKLPDAQMPDALLCELQGKLPFDMERAVIRHLTAGDVPGESEPRQEVIVLATARSTIDQYLEMARAARLDVVGINIGSCAVVECFSRLFRRSSDTVRTVMYLDIGAASTNVAMAQGGHLMFVRTLPLGGELFDKAVAAGMKLPLEQANRMRRELLKASAPTVAEDELYRLLEPCLDRLGDEINQCLRYHESVFRGHGVERAVFAGGQAFDKRLCQALAQRLNLPAQIGDPLVRIARVGGAGMAIGLDRREPQPNWAVAIGLSYGATIAA